MNNQNLGKYFYENLAHLFYAMAMADKKMTRDEKLSIIELVHLDWDMANDKMNSQEIIYQTLRDLIKTHKSADDAFDFFEQYYLKSKSVFTDEIKKRIMDSLDAIALAATGKRNKSELVMVTRLAMLF